MSNNTGLITNSFTPTASTNFDGANHLLTGGASYSDPSNILTGNQTVIGGYTLTYDAENRVSSSAIQSNTTTYVYDGNGHRVMKSTGTAATTYVYDAMNQLIAEYGNPTAPNSGTTYVSVDHLGSTRLVTTASQNQEACLDFLPFGEQIPSGTDGRTSSCFTSTATPLTQKFTGKERDPETNNDFFQARYISAPQGRFTSADPLGNFVADPTNPQTWNLYSYVWNSPLALIDPSGLDPQYGPIYQSGNCSYQDVTYGEGDRATTQTIDVGCLPTGQQTSSATRPSSPKPTSPQTTGNKNVFVCASEFAAKISIAGALQRFGIGTKGASGFITDALGGNAFSGATDLISSFVSGEGGGHNVFYNMAQGLAAGPTQGFGAALGNRIEGTPWASGPSDVATAAIARVAFPLMTGAGQTLQTLNGVAELGSIGMTAGEFATGVGAVKLGYDFLTYAGGLAGCGTGLIKQD